MCLSRLFLMLSNIIGAPAIAGEIVPWLGSPFKTR